jgi:hypothetical protein
LSRERRIEAILKELQPQIEAAVRRMVEQAVDAPEAEQFGAIDVAAVCACCQHSRNIHRRWNGEIERGGSR